MAITAAILKGERDPERLAELRDGRIAASRETIARALVGDYRAEHLFTLQQSLEAYRQYQKWIAACDIEIEDQLRKLPCNLSADLKPLSRPEDAHKPRRNELHFDLRGHLYRIFGRDLTEIPGISSLTANTLLTEVGPDLHRFPNASAFASLACNAEAFSKASAIERLIPVVLARVARADPADKTGVAKSFPFGKMCAVR